MSAVATMKNERCFVFLFLGFFFLVFGLHLLIDAAPSELHWGPAQDLRA